MTELRPWVWCLPFLEYGVRSIRRSVKRSVLLSVYCHVVCVVALGLWKCNSYLKTCWTVCSWSSVQQLARLICRANTYDHVSSLLQELHSLPVPTSWQRQIGLHTGRWCSVASLVGTTWQPITYEVTIRYDIRYDRSWRDDQPNLQRTAQKRKKITKN